ncbi:hypothetical protein ACYZTX_29130 [Pseudomonas sp. MDT1-17]
MDKYTLVTLFPCHYHRFCQGYLDAAQPLQGDLCPDCFAKIDDGYERVELQEQADRQNAQEQERGRVGEGQRILAMPMIDSERFKHHLITAKDARAAWVAATNALLAVDRYDRVAWAEQCLERAQRGEPLPWEPARPSPAAPRNDHSEAKESQLCQ